PVVLPPSNSPIRHNSSIPPPNIPVSTPIPPSPPNRTTNYIAPTQPPPVKAPVVHKAPPPHSSNEPPPTKSRPKSKPIHHNPPPPSGPESSPRHPDPPTPSRGSKVPPVDNSVSPTNSPPTIFPPTMSPSVETTTDRKITWVAWDEVLASKKHGGLGVSSYYALNRALLLKWVQVLISKGFDFLSHCKIRVGNSLNTRFWLDTWIMDLPLSIRFPRIYALEGIKEVSVAAKWGAPSFDESFRRQVRDGVESQQWSELLSLLGTFIFSPSSDRWICDLNGDGMFRVKDIRSYLDDLFLPSSNEATRRVKYVPIKVNIFAWRARLDRLPTRDNLAKRGINMVSTLCPVCDSFLEDVQHLFFGCDLAKSIFQRICRWCNLHWVDVSSFVEWNTWFTSNRLSGKLKSLLEGVFITSWWFIWSFRNRSIFDESLPWRSMMFDDIVSFSFNCHESSKKLSWVKWSNTLASFDKGGLGVGSLSAFNKALLLKWRWRLFNFPNSLWVQIIKAFHGKEADCFISQRILNGSWEWNWCRLITMGRSKTEFVNLIIDISNMEINDLVESDTCVWSLSNDDSFSVNSVRKHIDEHSLPSLFSCTRWYKMIPKKVNVFMWRMLLDRLPNRLNLSSRGLEIDSISCMVCNGHVESNDHIFFTCDHIFFTCDTAVAIWNLVRSWIDLPLPSFLSCEDWTNWFDS
nr:RNA-directed DNA polymerase, eukaryota [Tanacetum cinerariifolium]